MAETAGQQVDESDEEADAREEEREAVDDRIGGAQVMVGEEDVEQLGQAEPDQDQQRNRQSNRLPENAPQRGRENLAGRRENRLDQHLSSVSFTQASLNAGSGAYL